MLTDLCLAVDTIKKKERSMYSKILSESRQNELLVLYAIIQKKQTLHSLSTQLAIPSRTIKSYLQKLNIEIEELVDLSNFIHANSKGEYTINPLFSEKKLVVYHQLKLHYLKKSPYFNLIVLLTTNYQLSVTELADELFVTSSYLSRIIKSLNEKLSVFDFQIIKEESYVRLTGNELSIRIFSFLLLGDAFQSLEWPFKQFTKDELRHELPKDILNESAKRSDTKKNLLYFLFAVLTIRIQHQAFPKKPTPEELAILELIQKNHDIARLFSSHSFNDLPFKDNKNEILYFNFFTRIFLSDIILHEKKIALGKVFSKKEEDATAFAFQLTNALKQHFKGNFTEETTFLFIYYFTLLYVFFQLMGAKIPYFLELHFPKPVYNLSVNDSKMIEIKKFYDHFSKKVLHNQHYELLKHTLLRDYFCSLIYTLLQIVKTPRIFIYLQITKDFTGKFFITEQLSTIFNAETVVITEDVRKAHLIISDTLELSTNCKSIFFLSSLKNQHQWYELIQIIQQLLLEELFVEETSEEKNENNWLR